MGLFRRLFGAKKDKKKASKPSFSNSNNNLSSHSTGFSIHYDSDNLDANKHAIAVAAATAAVAEAALAAAQAAAEVVRLTNAGGRGGGGGGGGGGRSVSSAQQLSLSHRRWVEDVSAIKIQSAFRGYLARRALRALKALVKLQALVRGHIVRKQTADMLRRMQTMVRLQARARASRSHMPESWHSTTKSSYSRVPSNPLKDQSLRASSTKFDGSSILKRCGSNANFRDVFDQERAKLGPNWLDRWMEESLLRNQHAEDEKADKILEVDTWKPHVSSQQNNRTFQQYAMPDNNYQSLTTYDSPSKLSRKAPSQLLSVSSGEALPYNSIKLPQRKDEVASMTAEESPHVQSATSRPGSSGRRGAFTPTRSECSWGYFSGYSGYPSYMANTESFQAKVRSQSAPRQRHELEKYGFSNRSVQSYYDTDTLSERGFAQHTAYKNRPHQASGSLKRVGSSTNSR